ncbi:class I SAM-dependent methyltransferase [Methanosalsum natronophilum]|uniref:Class I SAM-dependent methyltransferase n=1 Tax=Methanosalsum natronophilum TaxID=768733 RepID=A0A3R7X7D7_9EURY|nr:class I SAM-dependent methyltransferase [Methanosalsum natronophilum]MCS3924005.1 ubiquinone/menaquinone biosynthesis C-methylase UbiE [Methanosalsum natronophilum]RQD88090.1 MAG: class I SAM-dependent methyltransferase [Methanosalsum natronophilum]
MKDRSLAINQINAWDEEYISLKWGGPRSIKRIKEKLSQGSILLDAGCGNGRYTIPLASDFDVFGVDFSMRGIHETKYNLIKNNCSPKCAVSNVICLPFKGNTFDGVILYGVLQHLLKEDRYKCAIEVQRVIKKQGFLFIEVFGIDDMRYGGIEVEANTFKRKNEIIYHYFTTDELKKLFSSFKSINVWEEKKIKYFKGSTYLRHKIYAIISAY